MTLVYEDKAVTGAEVKKAGVHMLVIGVGTYPHLPGGGGAVTRYHDNMRQLSSPPESARAVAAWFIERFAHPDRPLATVDLLLSAESADFHRPARPGAEATAPAATIAVESATLANIRKAARAWRKLGNQHPGSLMLFYFCGHGLMAGTEFSLVARDFGEDDEIDGLIDFSSFLTGMGDCQSKEQCFFIDACRVGSGKILADANSSGDPLVLTPGGLPGGLKRSIYYSTLGGAKAHGRKNKPSIFTAALLRALEGPGASNTAGPWTVTTTRLLEALGHLMVSLPDPDLPTVQVPEAGQQALFDLHRLPGEPRVPLIITLPPYRGTKPPAFVSAVEIKRQQALVAGWSNPRRPYPSMVEWRKRHFETWLTVGEYQVIRCKNGALVETPCNLSTPGYIMTDV